MNNHNSLNLNLSQYINLFNEITKGNGTWKVAIYVRLSKDDGNSVSLSIINQIKKIARFLRNFEDFEIIDIYIDDGKTGTDFDRKDYVRLQKDIANKKVNCIIVKDLTRYARNVADGIKGLEDFVLEQKIRFISLGIPEIDTFKNPKAISSAEVYQALNAAEEFARSTSIKVRDIKEIKRESGEKNGGFPPYGYLPNPDGEHWLYDPVAGKIKQRMYLWSTDGMSDREISKKLNSLGIPNPTAYKQSIGLNYKSPHSVNNSGLWWPTTVRRILEDKNNIGCSVQGKSSSFDHKRHKQIPNPKSEYVVVPNCHEKTISEETYDKVAQIRGQRSRITKNTGKVHLFANLVYCANCGKAMQRTNSRGKFYLVCRTYRIMGKEYCNIRNCISFKTIEDIVLKTIQMQIMLVADLQCIFERINSLPIANNQSFRINQLITHNKQAISQAECLMDSGYFDWKSGDISKDQYQRIRSDTEHKLEHLKATLQTLLSEQQQITDDIKTSNGYFERFSKHKNIESLDRLVLINLIDKIYIYKDKRIKIRFKFKDQYLLIMDYITQSKEQLSGWF